jgi:hypothetical protein
MATGSAVGVAGLRQAMGFTGTAVFTLTLGIAGASVMFALIEGVLLRPLPVHEQDRLLVAWKELRSAGFAHYPFRMVEIDTLSNEGRLFESAAGVDYNGAQPWVVVENGSATFVQSAAITGRRAAILCAARQYRCRSTGSRRFRRAR